MRVGLIAAGLTAIMGQVLLMRELAAVFYGNELVYGLALAVWMLWVAAGARLGGQLRSRSLFGAGLYLAAAVLPAQIAFVRGVRPLTGITPGAFVGLDTVLWATVIALAPLCILSGALFGLGARLLAAEGGTVGRAYLYESLGSMIGGALFSFLLVSLLNPFQVAILVIGVDLAVAGWFQLGPTHLRRHLSRGVLPLAALVAATVALSLPLGEALHRRTLDWSWSHRVLAADTRYGRLIVTALDGQRAFFQDGRLLFETQSAFPEEVAHLPLLAHPDPRRVLLIGGGVDGTLREILRHPVGSVRYVELDPLVITAAREYLPPADAAVLDDPRVGVVLGDGRRLVKESRDSFDVVILSLPEPATGQLNRFYTREFFQEVKARLAPGGLLSLGLPSAENYWSPELTRRNASVYRTLGEVFAIVAVTPGEVNFFLASDEGLDLTPAVLSARLEERKIETRWLTADYLAYTLAGGRYAQVQAQLEGESGVQINRDLVPVCYYYDMVLWLSRFYGRLRGFFESDSPVRLGWLLPLIAAGVLLLRGRREWAVPSIVAISGFSEMTLQVVVLLAFQSLHGYVYHQLGLVIAAFMGGLAVGAWAADRIARTWFVSRPRFSLILLQLVLALYAVTVPFLLHRSPRLATLTFALLALVSGALGGAIFALAAGQAQAAGGAPGQVAGHLYAADLIGGCVGAVAAAGLLVPVLGIPQTCAAVALLNLGGGLLPRRPAAAPPEA
jgi:spermidine synthase